MKLSLPLIISALIVSAALAADTSFKESVYLEAKMLDEKFNIDKDIILAYAKTETDFQPYVIAIKTKTPDFTHWVFQQVGYKAKKSKNLPYVSVFPADVKSAEFLYDFMIMNKKALEIIDYDFGLMQLNTRTIAGYGIDQEGEKELYLDYKKNMLYGADIIRGCYNMLKAKTGLENIIECYNRGVSIRHLNNSPRTYLDKFAKNYKNIKGLQ